jgi:hypothetical protein
MNVDSLAAWGLEALPYCWSLQNNRNSNPIGHVLHLPSSASVIFPVTQPGKCGQMRENVTVPQSHFGLLAPNKMADAGKIVQCGDTHLTHLTLQMRRGTDTCQSFMLRGPGCRKAFGFLCS